MPSQSSVFFVQTDWAVVDHFSAKFQMVSAWKAKGLELLIMNGRKTYRGGKEGERCKEVHRDYIG